LYISAANGHVNRVGVASEDDVTDSLTNDASSLEVTCHESGSDDGACVEMLPAAGGVDSDDDNENENDNDKPSS